MIILHWNPNLFHDHLALDNSPPPALPGIISTATLSDFRVDRYPDRQR
jgi:hypothetical protein